MAKATCNRKGEPTSGKRNAAQPDAEQEEAHLDMDGQDGGEAEPEVQFATWTIAMAGAIQKVGSSVQNALTNDSLMRYIIQWCETPLERKAGVAYTDGSMLYDVNEHIIIDHVEHSPANDIYVSIDHPISYVRISDPYLDAAKRRVLDFYAKTFFANKPVFICNQAAIGMAKRGKNVDRCFIGQSPGGVGQSLYSFHLDAIFGRLHAFFDPNIWYDDNELRKQIEQWEGCIVLTGQEAPETNKKMREDLFKKTMSGDSLAGRKPYGIVTRIMKLVGWKRMEVNKLMTFSAVKERCGSQWFSRVQSLARFCFFVDCNVSWFLRIPYFRSFSRLW